MGKQEDNQNTARDRYYKGLKKSADEWRAEASRRRLENIRLHDEISTLKSKLDESMQMPKLITLSPDVARCEALREKLAEI